MTKFTLVLQDLLDDSIHVVHSEASCLHEAMKQRTTCYVKLVIIAAFEGHHVDISEEYGDEEVL